MGSIQNTLCQNWNLLMPNLILNNSTISKLNSIKKFMTSNTTDDSDISFLKVYIIFIDPGPYLNLLTKIDYLISTK